VAHSPDHSPLLGAIHAPASAVLTRCPRNRVKSTYYRWERVAKAGMRDVLGDRRRNGKAVDREVERLQAELAQKRQIIAEVVEENLELKKGL